MGFKVKWESSISADFESGVKTLKGQAQELLALHLSKIEELATRDAPKFISLYSQYSSEGSKLKGEVGVSGDDPIQAYIEFGTGMYAKELLSGYPDWVVEIAWQFKRPIDGFLPSQPYLYPNFRALEHEFILALKKLVDG